MLEWMTLQMQKFYSSCDTAQSTHGKKNFLLWQMGLKRDPSVAGPFEFLNALPLHNSTCSVANFWARQKIDFDNTSHCPIGKAER